VAGDGDALRVLLDRRVDDLGDAAVVAEVDDLGTGGLPQPAHDVDRGVVSVEEGGGGDQPYRVARAVVLRARWLLDRDRLRHRAAIIPRWRAAPGGHGPRYVRATPKPPPSPAGSHFGPPCRKRNGAADPRRPPLPVSC